MARGGQAGGWLPFHIGTLIVVPGTKPHAFKVEFSPEALTAVGVLASVADCFARNRAAVLSMHVAGGSEGPLWALAIAHLPDEKRVSDILKCLESVKYVKSVEHSPPVAEGVAVDVWGYPPLLGGVRSVFLREPMLRNFLYYGWRHMGSGFGSILYHTFFDAGAEMYTEFFSKLAKSREEQARLAEHVFRLAGYGILEVREFTSNRFVARVYDSVECRNLPPDVGEAESMLVRALLAGFAAASWGVDRQGVLPQETKCIRRGDPYCEFVVTRKSL